MGCRYDDKLFRLTVDVPDTEQSLAWMVEFKHELRARFEHRSVLVQAVRCEVSGAFDSAVAEGRALGYEQAVDLAVNTAVATLA